MEDKVALLEQICNLKGRVINLQESRITGRPVVATRNKATQTQQEEFGATGGESQNSGDLTLLEELSLQEVTMDEVTEAALLEDDRPLQICLDEEEVSSLEGGGRARVPSCMEDGDASSLCEERECIFLTWKTRMSLPHDEEDEST